MSRREELNAIIADAEAELEELDNEPSGTVVKIVTLTRDYNSAEIIEEVLGLPPKLSWAGKLGAMAYSTISNVDALVEFNFDTGTTRVLEFIYDNKVYTAEEKK